MLQPGLSGTQVRTRLHGQNPFCYQKRHGIYPMNLHHLRNSGDATVQAWAKKIDDARTSGKLKGMVVTTKVDGADAFVPDAELKDWAQIGATTW
jgi:hypothetical protein